MGCGVGLAANTFSASIISAIILAMMYNWQNWHSMWQMPWSMNWFSGAGWVFFALLIAWSLVWKGMALWKAARRGSTVWFVVLLVVSTAGILDILYLYVFSKKFAPVKE